jgi:hypothetical protein
MLGHAAGFGYDIRSNKPLSPRMAQDSLRGGRTSPCWETRIFTTAPTCPTPSHFSFRN